MFTPRPHTCDCPHCPKAHERWSHNFRLREIAERANENLEVRAREAELRLAEVEAERDAAVRERDDMAPLARLGLWTLEKIRGVYAGDIDAWAVQEEAERLGVIEPVEAPKPCGDCCVCAEMDADICYRDTKATSRYRIAATAQDSVDDDYGPNDGEARTVNHTRATAQGE